MLADQFLYLPRLGPISGFPCGFPCPFPCGFLNFSRMTGGFPDWEWDSGPRSLPTSIRHIGVAP